MVEPVSYHKRDENGLAANDAVVSSGTDFEDMGKEYKVNPETGSQVEINVNKEDSKKKKDDGEEKEEKEKEEEMVGTLQVFRFAGCVDIILMLLGTLAGAAHGTGLPLMILVFGDMIDSFTVNGQLLMTLTSENLKTINLTSKLVTENKTMFQTACQLLLNRSCTDKEFTDFDILTQMQGYAIYYVIIGCGILVCGYMQITFWMLAAERQTRKIRKHFFHSVMHQEIGWFDTHDSGELNTRLSEDIKKIQGGIGDKLGSFNQWFFGFLAGIVIGFVKGWKLTLVILSVSPLIVVSAALMSKLAADMTSKELKAYAKAGSIAEEVISSIRTVFAFGGHEKECVRYNNNLHDASAFGVKKATSNGLGMGFVWLVIFGSYALGFGYGAQLVREEAEYTVGVMLVVFFSVLIAAFSIGNAAPNLQALATARGAAFTIFNIIDRKPLIDSSSPDGEQPSSITGNLEFKDVHFIYPARPDVKVLNGLNLKVDNGKTVALVGSSGCGKSTTVQLIQRFYDPISGSICLDGKDLKDLNVRWLREHIGIVSQEPILFQTTIAENIRYGREDVTMEEIEQAAKEANAFDFIDKLPEKFDTLAGERGAQLSGGQKQRIAIARALVKNPRILLLDEATSALDTESEAIVQSALDKVRQGRTTIIIAHRLSTVRTADLIAGFRDGVLVEQGTHEELMKNENGVYYSLVTTQSEREEKEKKKLKKDMDESTSSSDDEALENGTVDSPKRQFSRLLSATSVRSQEHAHDRQLSVKDKKKEEEDEEKDLPDVGMGRMMKINAPEWPYIIIGCFASLLNGGIQPAFAVIFAEIIGVFSNPDIEKQKRDTTMYSLILLGLGVIGFIAMFLQSYMFGKSGEALTMRLRMMTFKAILRQDVGWFDLPKNNTGAICTRLATDASAVQGATGVRIASFLQALSNIGVAIVIAFIYSWELTLLLLGFLPFIGAAGMIEMKILQGVAGRDKEALEEAGKVAVEGIENVRTVAGLSKEDKFNELYNQQLHKPYKTALRQAHAVGFAFGFSQCIIFFAYAAAFYVGAILIREERRNFTDVMKVFSAIVFGAMGLGQAMSFAPDYSKAKVSAAKIAVLLDQVPEIDSYSEDGIKPEDIHCEIEFSQVHFYYPSRPNTAILRGLDLKVGPGEKLALVGSSGCGKSTTVQLIERFYNPAKGQVLLEGKSVDQYNLHWLRQQIGLVSQEPVLFDCSIADNIAYGDNDRVVPMEEIIEAAKKANIHSFISTLPLGYETNVGDKGTQLSGGQKQRVAIARALVRNPKILLLDEATSALDTESEQVVQEALDRAQEGRTCIIIAHRLSTIQNADRIVVFHHGRVRESGTHSELMKKQGHYYRLNVAQTSASN